MAKYHIPRLCGLKDIPEFQRFQAGNPQNIIEEQQTIINFGRAIHWLSIYEILWPDFEQVDYYWVELADIAINDPDKPILPDNFYDQLAEILRTFWTIQLEDLYPEGDWEVVIHDDDEITVDVTIRRRTKDQ